MNNFYGFNNEKKYLIDNFKNYSLSNSIIFHGEKGIGKQTFVFNLIKEFILKSTKITKKLFTPFKKIINRPVNIALTGTGEWLDPSTVQLQFQLKNEQNGKLYVVGAPHSFII